MKDAAGGMFEDPALADFILRDIIFRRPARLAQPNPWAGHIPFAFWAIDVLRPKTVVELGVHSGNSLCAFAQAIDDLNHPGRLYGIDLWGDGDRHAGYYDGEAVLRDLRAHHDPRYGRFSSLIRASFDEALDRFADGEIDLLHIDGLHGYDDVRHDFETWSAKLAPGAVVLFHDTGVRERDFGVHRFFAERARERANFLFRHSNGLGVLAADEAAAHGPFERLFAHGETADGERIRRVFAAIGEGHAMDLAAQAWEADGRALRADMASLAQSRERRREAEERWKAIAAERAATIDELSKDAEALRRQAARLGRRLAPIVHHPQAVERHKSQAAASRREAQVERAARRRAEERHAALEARYAALEDRLRRFEASAAWRLLSLITSFASRLRRLARPAPETAAPTEAASSAPPKLETAPPARPARRFAVLLHLYYLDQWETFERIFQGFGRPFDLFVTTPDTQADEAGRTVRANFPDAALIPVPNRGRDVAPFLTVLKSGRLDDYEAVLKLHTKASPHLANGEDWRDEILHSLAPDAAGLDRLLTIFDARPELGMVGPERQRLAEHSGWGVNRARYERLLARFDVTGPAACLDFFQGTMFWFRPAALARLKAADIALKDFDPERGQTDGTLAHVLERAIPAFMRADGFVMADMRQLGLTALTAPPAPRRAADEATHPDEDARFTATPRDIAHPEHVRGRDVIRLASGGGEGRAPRVAIIILSRNGAPALDMCLRSIVERVRYPNFFVTLVDHASEDATDAIVEKWSARLDLRPIRAPGNFSYSASNNRAAEAADADILMFLNNDAVLLDDVVGEGVRALEDERVGVVACRLVDPDGRTNHIGIRFDDPDASTHARRPRNVPGDLAADARLAEETVRADAVCFAVTLVRRKDYLAHGGLHEGYVYGYEDVDFCLGLAARRGLWSVCLNGSVARHGHGRTRSKDGSERRRAMMRINMATLSRRRAAWIRAARRRDLVDNGGERFLRSPKIAFVVERPDTSVDMVDSQWARGLGAALTSRFGWESALLPLSDKLDVTGVDILVHLHRRPRPRALIGAKPDLIRAAWVRDEFDLWPQHPWVHDLDAVFLAGAGPRERYERDYGLPAFVLPAAADETILAAHAPDFPVDRDFDIVVLAHSKPAPRRLEAVFEPSAFEARCHIFGHGWKEHPIYGRYGEKPVGRFAQARIYARSRLVLDDSGDEAVEEGVVNPRVFQAAAAGCLPLSDNPAVRDLFGEAVPVWSDRASFETQARLSLSDEDRRADLAAMMQDEVLKKHTFAHRAEAFVDALRTVARRGHRISIKTPHAWRSPAERDEWRARARALQRALKTRGHVVRVDAIQDYRAISTEGDDCVIVLRGGAPYAPRSGQVTIGWLWGDAAGVPETELAGYDHLFVASEAAAEKARAKTSCGVECLFPGLAASAWARRGSGGGAGDHALVLGHGRTARRALREAGVEHRAYGRPGEEDPLAFAGDFAPVEWRGALFAEARMVVVDHDAVDADAGYLDPALFEAAGHGAVVAARRTPAAEKLLGAEAPLWRDAADLKALFARFADVDVRAREAARLSERLAAHGADAVADKIDAVVRRLVGEAIAGPIDAPLQDRRGREPSFDGLVSSEELFGYDRLDHRKTSDWTLKRHLVNKAT